MNDITIYGIVFAIVVLAVIQAQRKKQLIKQKQITGIHSLKLLRVLLAGIQKHRGQTMAYIKGEKDALPIIEGLQRRVNLDIQAVEQAGAWFKSNEQWLSLTQHWYRLEENYSQLTVEDNLEQHGKLIKNILYLIEEMAEEHFLLRVEQFKRYGCDSLWKDLLTTAEYMGQARALGVGIVASGECSSVERIRIHYLHDKIKASIARLADKMPTVWQANPTVTRLIQCLAEDLTNNPKALSSTEYFELATKAIDSLYEQFDKALAWL